MHGSHFARWYSGHREAIYLNEGVFWPESVQLHDSLICRKPNRMLQNTVQIQQQDRRLHGADSCDAMKVILSSISSAATHDPPLTNNCVCTGSVVHEFIITCY